MTIGCSIGIAIAPHDGDDSQALIRNADLGLYAAKGDGRGVHRFYAEAMLEGARSRKRMEEDLRIAIAQGQFHLVYQPVVSTRCLLYTSPSPRDRSLSRMPSSA